MPNVENIWTYINIIQYAIEGAHGMSNIKLIPSGWSAYHMVIPPSCEWNHPTRDTSHPQTSNSNSIKRRTHRSWVVASLTPLPGQMRRAKVDFSKAGWQQQPSNPFPTIKHPCLGPLCRNSSFQCREVFLIHHKSYSSCSYHFPSTESIPVMLPSGNSTKLWKTW